MLSIRYSMSARYLIRADKAHNLDEVSFPKWVQANGKGIVVYENPAGENPHYHAWVETRKQLQTLRVSFKKEFPDHKGNGSFSMSNKPGNLAYLVKGGEVVFNDLVTPTELAAAKEEQKEYADRVKTAQKREKVKAAEKSNFQAALEYVRPRFEAALELCARWVPQYDDQQRMAAGMCLVEYYRERVKCEPSEFQLKAMAASIVGHILQGKNRVEYDQARLARLFNSVK